MSERLALYHFTSTSLCYVALVYDSFNQHLKHWHELSNSWLIFTIFPFFFFLMSTISAYEHAVRAAGTDFRSDRLWEAFINWETEQQKLANVTAIYDRILGIPTQLYSQHFQRYVCISVTLFAVSIGTGSLYLKVDSEGNLFFSVAPANTKKGVFA